MEIKLGYSRFKDIESELIVILIDGESILGEVEDEEIELLLKQLVKDYNNKKIKREYYYTNIKGRKGKDLLVYWTGLNLLYNLKETIKIFMYRTLEFCKSYSKKKMSILMNKRECIDYLGAVIEGAILGSYTFDKYKKEREDYFNDFELTIVGYKRNRDREREILDRRQLISEIVNECRDVINEPGCVIYPMALAELAKEIGRKYGIRVKVWEKKDLQREGYNGLLQVGAGSKHSPCMVMMEYTNEYPLKIGLVGKGITFDTGGISLKPATRMSDMKGDMAGAAVVMYVMKAIAKLGTKINLVGIMALAENIPSSTAQRPGDIFYAKNGKSIVVENTDAEGRLILTDAFYLAGKKKCLNLIDIATLTGACVKALGTSVAGIMGNDKELIEAIIRAGKDEGEEYWELPLVEEYKEMLKSNVADISNIGGVNAGAITAALFLREFIPEDVSWAHLDIAGPFLQEKVWKYYEAGATGFGLKTLINLIYNYEDYYLGINKKIRNG